MKKQSLALSIGLLMSASVAAETAPKNIWDNVEMPGYGKTQIPIEALQDIGGFGTVLLPTESMPAVKRTRALTGFEYEEYVYDNAPSEFYQSFIFADGSTKVSERWRIAYLLKETHRYSGEDKTSLGQPLLTTEIMPRYEHWVNENFNYVVELGYEKVTGFQETTRYQITPELNFSLGKHFLHLNLEMGYWEEEKAEFYETEPLYVYRFNDWINLGTKVLYHEDTNDFAWTEKAIKPLVQFRFDNNVYLELRYELGETEIHDGSGYRYNNYALYTEIPLNDTFSVLADLAYRDQKQHHGNQYSWGDKEGVFAKVGLIWTF
ncbi:hypothetical protein L4C36_17600 [Photobacterium japonica]|uniref:hypothetical protein n=1 Tax=Photobacterium japonica TaxID=2910235 RepID=UPI003D12C912